MNKFFNSDNVKTNKSTSFIKKGITILIFSCIYAGLFFLIYSRIQMGIITNLTLIPVILVAWWWGRIAGISMYLINQAWTSFFIRLINPGTTIMAMEPILGILTQTFFALAIGTVSTLTKKLRDEVSEREKAEKKLKAYQDNLESIVKQKTIELERTNEKMFQIEKMEAIGQLAGGVAHDFNNQLTIIIGYCDILKAALSNAPDLHEYADRIYCSGRRAADLTKQLLAFARKGKYKSQATNVNDIITEVFTLLSRSIDKKIAVVQEFTAIKPYVWGEPTLIQNAVINLVLNARDAMEQGGELILRTSNEDIDHDFCTQHNLDIKPGSYVTVSVIDTGSGIDEKHMQHIFEPFFTTKAEGKGTGMGLAAVYGIMKSHNGGIWVRSKAGEGSLFKLYFPQIPAPHLNFQTDADRPILPVQKSSHILIVDDEEDVAETIKEMLERLGYKITIKTSGREAIAFYSKIWTEIDLVLLDMIMPEMNGRELFQILKKINPQIKAILSSGYGLTNQVKEILQEGVLLFIQKPYTMAELAQRLQKILNNETEKNPNSEPIRKRSVN